MYLCIVSKKINLEYIFYVDPYILAIFINYIFDGYDVDFEFNKANNIFKTIDKRFPGLNVNILYQEVPLIDGFIDEFRMHYGIHNYHNYFYQMKK